MNPKDYSDLYEEWETEQTTNTALKSLTSISAGTITAAHISPNTSIGSGYYSSPGYVPNTGQPIMASPDPRVIDLEVQVNQLRQLIDTLTDASEETRALLDGFVIQIGQLTEVIRLLQEDQSIKNSEPLEQLSAGEVMKQIQGPDA